jgi:transcription antitermination factor NusG
MLMARDGEAGTDWQTLEAKRLKAEDAKTERLREHREASGGRLDQVLDQITSKIDKVDRRPIGAVAERLWYMLIVRPNHELDAIDSFRRNGVRAYWPNYGKLGPGRQIVNGFRSRQKYLAGVVPGYIFSPGSQTEDLTFLLERVTGVINVLRTHSGVPVFLSEPDVDLIRKIEAGLNTPDRPKSTHKFKLGMKVRFTDDRAALWRAGKISAMANNGKITVDVPLEKGGVMPVVCLPHQIEGA